MAVSLAMAIIWWGATSECFYGWVNVSMRLPRGPSDVAEVSTPDISIICMILYMYDASHYDQPNCHKC
jgi:hypothetical protein